MNQKERKVCFTASSGGHLEQLMMLKPMMNQYDSFIVTEKMSYKENTYGIKTYYLKQINRREVLFPAKMIYNIIMSARIMLREKPDVVISIGVLATVPISLLAKVMGKKLVYIESFAKVKTATMTGRLMYKFADLFVVQWESMLDIYPGALYLGSIY